MIDAITLVPILTSATGVAIAGWRLLTSVRARSDVSKSVRASAADAREVRVLLDAKNVDAAAAVVRKHSAALPQAERREVESALAQPSTSGRASYIRGIAGEAPRGP